MIDQVNSPLGIEIALRFHYDRSATVDDPSFSSPAAIRCIEQFVGLGLLEPDSEGVPRANYEALRLYVDALCSVPFPVQRWTMPATTEGGRP